MTQKRSLIENPQTDPIFDESTETELVGTAPVAPIAPTPEPVEVTREQLRAALEHRVEAAKTSIETARQTQRDNAEKETASRNELQAARAALLKEFPPVTSAQNIRNHLAAENAARVARVEAQKAMGITNPAASHLDAIRNPGRNSVNRGFGRGRSAGTFSRKEYGRVVPGSPADLAQAAARAARVFTPPSKA